LKPLLRVSVVAEPDRLKELRDAAREVLTPWGCSEELTRALVLALGEAAMNVVQHGFDGGSASGEITLEILDNSDELVFRLSDDAPTADPAKMSPRDLDDLRPGGLGSHFMRELMDRTAFLPPPEGGGNLLEMRKKVSRS